MKKALCILLTVLMVINVIGLPAIAAADSEQTDLSIITQPQNYVGQIGDMATFTVEAQGMGLTYQWQWFNGTTWANTSVNGNKTNTVSMKITSGRLAAQYRCVITDENGERVISDAVRMIEYIPLEITAQPENYAGQIGDTATFTVEAQGMGLTYQWQW